MLGTPAEKSKAIKVTCGVCYCPSPHGRATVGRDGIFFRPRDQQQTCFNVLHNRAVFLVGYQGKSCSFGLTETCGDYVGGGHGLAEIGLKMHCCVMHQCAERLFNNRGLNQGYRTLHALSRSPWATQALVIDTALVAM